MRTGKRQAHPQLKEAGNVKELAAAFRTQFDTLAAEYERRLQEYPEYAVIPPQIRQGIVRRILGAVVEWLESGDDTGLLGFMRAMAQERAAHGRDIGDMRYAVMALNTLFEPLFPDLDTARNVWRSFFKVQEIISNAETERWRASEARLHQVVDRSPMGIFQTTLEGEMLDANPAFLKIIGYESLADVNRVGIAALYADPADWERLLAQAAQGPVIEFETRFRPAFGQIAIEAISAWLVRPPDAHPYLEGILEDVTERHQALVALEESRHLLQTVMDNIPQAIFWKDRSLTFLGCNRALADDAGLADPTAIIGKDDYAMPWYDQAAVYQADDRQVMATGVAKLNYEEPQTTPTGDVIWLRTSKIPLRDAQGAVVGVLGMYEDITEYRRAEEAMREAEERFRTIYEGSNDALMLLRPTGFFDCNRRTLELFGLATKEEFVAKHPAELSPPTQPNGEDSITAYQMHINLAYTQGYARFEWVHRRQDGEDFPAEVLLSAFELHGERVLQATVRDITRRRSLEDQIQESLARRERQVQTSIEVAQDIAMAPALDELLRRVVTLIKERFGYYHAQIFRYDPAHDAVVLVTGYGEAGRQMLAAGHKLPMGRGVVGTAAATGRSILAADSAKDKDWRPNPFLPETKGELAVPIKLRDQVLGILDVQSDQVDALTSEDQLLLEGLCGQIAVAMDSTRLVAELRRSQAELSEVMRIARLGYWQFDPTTGLFTFSDQFYNLFHTTAAREGGYRLSGAQYAEHFLHPDDAALVAEETERAMAYVGSHYTRTFEHRIVYADGGMGYMSVHINVDRDENGHILHYYGVNEDITERKLADMRIQETLQELERLYRATTGDGWQVFRETGQLAPAYRYDRMQVRPATAVWSPQVAEAVQRKTLVPPTPEEAVAAAPLTVRGEVVGALGVFDDPQRPLSADELALLQEIIEQGSLALESARLYQDTQRRAAREQLVGEVTGRIRETLDLNTVLQTAVREMGLATGADVVEVRLRTVSTSEETRK